jgi:hypothetical protein
MTVPWLPSKGGVTSAAHKLSFFPTRFRLTKYVKWQVIQRLLYTRSGHIASD